jgi:hypothetical protein
MAVDLRRLDELHRLADDSDTRIGELARRGEHLVQRLGTGLSDLRPGQALDQPEPPRSLGTLTESVQAFDRLPEELADDADALAAQIVGLGQDLLDFEENIEADYKRLGELTDEEADKLAEALEGLMDDLTVSLPETLRILLEQSLARLRDELADRGRAELAVATDLVSGRIEASGEAIDDAVRRLAATAGSLYRGLFARLREDMEQRIEDEARATAEALITDTLGAVAEDALLAQVSGQITAAMSAQLPQLIVAKQSVGAVKRLLELARAGF